MLLERQLPEPVFEAVIERVEMGVLLADLAFDPLGGRVVIPTAVEPGNDTLLAIDEGAQADLDMPADAADLGGPLGARVVAPGFEAVLVEEGLDKRPGGEGRVGGRAGGAGRGGRDIEKQRWLVGSHHAGLRRRHAEEPAVERVRAAVLDARSEDVDERRLLVAKAVENRSTAKIAVGHRQRMPTNGLEERMTGRHPFGRRLGLEEILVEDDPGVVLADPPVGGLEIVADRDDRP